MKKIWLVYVIAFPVAFAVWILIGMGAMLLNPEWAMWGGIVGAVAGFLVGSWLEKSLKGRWGLGADSRPS